MEDTDEIVGQRVPPTDPARIQRYARMHDPFNHPTVVYRRDAVLAAGGYGDLPLMEDYALFARMLQRGARAVNVAEPLVFYRVGAKAFKRRGGHGPAPLRAPAAARVPPARVHLAVPSTCATWWSAAATGSSPGGCGVRCTARSSRSTAGARGTGRRGRHAGMEPGECGPGEWEHQTSAAAFWRESAGA